MTSAAVGMASGTQVIKVDGQDVELTFQDVCVAGAAARLAAQVALHPIDVMKTRVQLRGALPNRFEGPGDAYRLFSRGITSCVLLAVPSGMLQFLVYEKSKKWLTDNLPQSHAGAVVAQLTAGALGSWLAGYLRVPQEVMRQRVQAEVYPNFVGCISGIIQNEGYGGFYTGFNSTLLRDIPQTMISFMIFDQIKELYTHAKGHPPAPIPNLFFGCSAGAFSSAVTCPLDVVKTRLMCQRRTDAEPYKNIFDVLQRVVKEEGPFALWKGVKQRVAYVGPLSAVMFAVNEGVKTTLCRWRLHNRRRLGVTAPVAKGKEKETSGKAAFQFRVGPFGARPLRARQAPAPAGAAAPSVGRARARQQQQQPAAAFAPAFAPASAAGRRTFHARA
eukprot:tig00021012_g16998.t1